MYRVMIGGPDDNKPTSGVSNVTTVVDGESNDSLYVHAESLCYGRNGRAIDHIAAITLYRQLMNNNDIRGYHRMGEIYARPPYDANILQPDWKVTYTHVMSCLCQCLSDDFALFV
jgi:hypothetical protein